MATEQEIANAQAAVNDLASQVTDERAKRQAAIDQAARSKRLAALRAEQDRLTRQLADERGATAAVQANGADAEGVEVRKGPDGRELGPGQIVVVPEVEAPPVPIPTPSSAASAALSAPEAATASSASSAGSPSA